MNKEKTHKAQKPFGLLSKIVDLFSRVNEVVLDQFSGSFALFDTCLQMQRIPVSIELDRELVNNKLKLLNS